MLIKLSTSTQVQNHALPRSSAFSGIELGESVNLRDSIMSSSDLRARLGDPLSPEVPGYLAENRAELGKAIEILRGLFKEVLSSALGADRLVSRFSSRQVLSRLAVGIRKFEDWILRNSQELWQCSIQPDGVNKVWDRCLNALLVISEEQKLSGLWQRSWGRIGASLLILQTIDTMRCVGVAASNVGLNVGIAPGLIHGYQKLRAHKLSSLDLGFVQISELVDPAWVEFLPVGLVVYLSDRDFDRHHPKILGLNFTTSGGILSLVRLKSPAEEVSVLKTRSHELLHAMFCSIYGMEYRELSAATDRFFKILAGKEDTIGAERARGEICTKFRAALLRTMSNEERSYRLSGDTYSWLSPEQLGFGALDSMIVDIAVRGSINQVESEQIETLIDNLRDVAQHCLRLAFRHQSVTLYLANSNAARMLPKDWLEVVTAYGVGREAQALNTLLGDDAAFSRVDHILEMAEARVLGRFGALARLIDLLWISNSDIRDPRYRKQFESAARDLEMQFRSEPEGRGLYLGLIELRDGDDDRELCRALFSALVRTSYEAASFSSGKLLPDIRTILHGMQPCRQLEGLWELAATILSVTSNVDEIDPDVVIGLQDLAERTATRLRNGHGDELWRKDITKSCRSVSASCKRLERGSSSVVTAELSEAQIESILGSLIQSGIVDRERLIRISEIVRIFPNCEKLHRAVALRADIFALSDLCLIGDDDTRSALAIISATLPVAAHLPVCAGLISWAERIISTLNIQRAIHCSYELEELVKAIERSVLPNSLSGRGCRLSERMRGLVMQRVPNLYSLSALFSAPPLVFQVESGLA